MQSWWSEWPRVIDTLLTAFLFWCVYRILRRRRQSYRLVVGVAILGLGYVLANAAGFELARAALLGLFATSAVVAIIGLQDDLRRALESLSFGKRAPVSSSVVDVLVHATERMADDNVGALVVLPGNDPITPHVTGGVRTDALLSEPLLLSLFDPRSPGHDGAMIICGGKVERFGVHLPLSHDEAELAGRGTRHASALGLSERTDALCIVVSEERGQISLASGGKLRIVDDAGLRMGIARHLRGETAHEEAVPTLRTKLTELGLALATAGVLWFAVVPGSALVTRTLRVPVSFENIPEGYEPAEQAVSVDVTLSGPRRAVYLLGQADVEIGLDAWFASAGKRTFGIDRADVRVPPDIQVLDVRPRRVELHVRRVTP